MEVERETRGEEGVEGDQDKKGRREGNREGEREGDKLLS